MKTKYTVAVSIIAILSIATIIMHSSLFKIMKSAHETVAPNTSRTNLATEVLVKNHLRHAAAYKLILKVQVKRMQRPWLSKFLFFALPSYAPGKNLNSSIEALNAAIEEGDQSQAQLAVETVRGNLRSYGENLGRISGMPEGKSVPLIILKCSAEDEKLLREIRGRMVSSLENFYSKRDVDSAERAFIDSWLACCIFYLIGPDYAEKRKDIGRTEVKTLLVNMKTFVTELADLATVQTADDRVRIQNQTKYLTIKISGLESRLN